MAKTMSFAVLHFSVAFSVAYVLTGDLVIGGAMALVEPAINTVAYYFHELAWGRSQKLARDEQADQQAVVLEV